MALALMALSIGCSSKSGGAPGSGAAGSGGTGGTGGAAGGSAGATGTAGAVASGGTGGTGGTASGSAGATGSAGTVASGGTGGNGGAAGGSQMVGTQGGSVATDGVTLTVPANALSVATTITVTTTTVTAPLGYMAVSAAYQFGPSGTTFAQPVAVTIPLTSAAPNAHLLWSNASGGFDDLGGTVSGTAVTGSVSHFSIGFAAVVLSHPVDAGVDAASADGGATVDAGCNGSASCAAGQVCCETDGGPPACMAPDYPLDGGSAPACLVMGSFCAESMSGPKQYCQTSYDCDHNCKPDGGTGSSGCSCSTCVKGTCLAF
jgi:hypothetical protein